MNDYQKAEHNLNVTIANLVKELSNVGDPEARAELFKAMAMLNVAQIALIYVTSNAPVILRGQVN